MNYIVKIKYVDKLILKNAWDLYCEYDICWWIEIEECEICIVNENEII